MSLNVNNVNPNPIPPIPIHTQPTDFLRTKILKIASAIFNAAAFLTFAVVAATLVTLTVTGIIGLPVGIMMILAATVKIFVLGYLFVKCTKNPTKVPCNHRQLQIEQSKKLYIDPQAKQPEVLQPPSQTQITKQAPITLYRVDFQDNDPLSIRPPILAKRIGNNCCFNTFAQLMITNRGLRNTLRNKNPACNQFITNYEQTYPERTLTGTHSQKLREKLHEIEPNSGWLNGNQGDVSAILQGFAGDAGYATCQKKGTKYRENPRAFGNPACLLLSGKGDFNTLVRNTIKPRPISKDNPNPDYSDIRIDGYPQDLILWHSTRDQSIEFSNPLVMNLPRDLFVDNKAAQYHCDFIAIHSGTTAQSGHYFCARKVNDIWYLIDDNNDLVLVIEEKEVKSYLEGEKRDCVVMGMNYKLYAKEV